MKAQTLTAALLPSDNLISSDISDILSLLQEPTGTERWAELQTVVGAPACPEPCLGHKAQTTTSWPGENLQKQRQAATL